MLVAADELTTRMMNELCSIKQPETALLPHVKNIQLALGKNSSTEVKTALKRMCLEMYQAERMPPNGNKNLAYQGVNEHVKKLQDAADRALSQWRDRAGKSELTKTILSVWNALRSLVQSPKIMRVKQLSDFSKLLASYQACKSPYEVEIPGQYTGDRLPNTKHHVKFSTFNPDIKIIRSKQKPIMFSCVGNNGRNYDYIMKAGEDLRQDERIQMLFGIMNNIFDEDQICRERQLNIKTYRVFTTN